MDDFLATSLLMHVHGLGNEYVERREPTEEDFNDPEVWVVDVGEKLNYGLHNFDHHGMACPIGLQGYMKDLEAKGSVSRKQSPAAFVLVLDYLMVHLDKTQVVDYNRMMTDDFFKASSFIDAYGPVSAEKAKISIKNSFANFVVKKFLLYVGVAFWDDTFKRFSEMEERANAASACSYGMIIPNAPDTKVLVFEWREKTLPAPIDECIDALRELKRWADSYPDIMIMEDDRGEGWMVKKQHGLVGWNFRKLEKNPNIRFINGNGTVFKTTTRTPLSDVVSLLKETRK